MDTQRPISTISEFDDSLAQCFSAKNALVRVRGFSPEQLVLGKSVRVPASLTSCDSAASHEMAVADGLEGETFCLSLARRAAARQAFHESDNDDAMRRALLRRSNPQRGPFLPGQWLLYWIKRTNPNRQQAGKWHGPAKVIATDGQSTVWLSHGTKTILPLKYCLLAKSTHHVLKISRCLMMTMQPMSCRRNLLAVRRAFCSLRRICVLPSRPVPCWRLLSCIPGFLAHFPRSFWQRII